MGKFKSKRSYNSTGRPDSAHASFTDDEKRKYQRKATAKSRGQLTEMEDIDTFINEY